MISVVVFQNCMGSVESEIGSCSEICVMCAVDGTYEISIKVEEELDIKDEIPEINTENEVRLRGLCEFVAAHAS
jgi:hypothetical protein